MCSDLLKIVIITQLLPCHDPAISCKESHTRLPCNSPLLHPAIRLARVINKASNGPSSGINDHVLIKVHQIIALCCEVNNDKKQPLGERNTHFIVLVYSPHSPLTLPLVDDLTCVLHNNLIWFKAAIAANAIASICSLYNLNSNIILAASLGAMFKLIETAVTAFWAQSTIATVTFVEHITVLAVLVTTSILSAHASRKLQFLVCFPLASRVTHEHI